MNQALTTRQRSPSVPPPMAVPNSRPWKKLRAAASAKSKPNSSRIHAEDKLQLQVFCSGDLRRLQRFLSNRFHSQ
ncbi:hypothetical protein CSA_004592 [Cucumis sativus]|uniref:Uncharacterized protein n=1 Tax=Cucumis sativus TaxID=3659 RepID=A0ACB6HB06_CUCSA|nr:hypothetical protein CSA_004592 [Cucumis sativus]